MGKRCVDCGRRIDRAPAGTDNGRPVGPKCWRKRGMATTMLAARATPWRPAIRPRAADDGMDLLDVLAAMGGETALTSDGVDH